MDRSTDEDTDLLCFDDMIAEAKMYREDTFDMGRLESKHRAVLPLGTAYGQAPNENAREAI